MMYLFLYLKGAVSMMYLYLEGVGNDVPVFIRCSANGWSILVKFVDDETHKVHRLE